MHGGIETVPKVVLIAFLGLALGACAAPAAPENMTVEKTAVVAGADPWLLGAVYLDEVRGGEPTNPLWISEVGNEEFRDALARSLRNAGYLNEDAADSALILKAHLLGLSQPIYGFEMEVTAHVNYEVVVKESDSPYLLETVTTAYAADMGDAILGPKRLQVANEGAIRQNIREFLDRLSSAARAGND